MKLDIPKFSYLAQDEDGEIWAFCERPILKNSYSIWVCDIEGMCIQRKNVRRNKNWQDTLIDLETDDYEFEDGILRRIEK